MRTSSVLGTPSSRRTTVRRTLAVGLLTASLAALGAGTASALESRAGDGYRGDRWDGGHAWTGGHEYSWPENTYDFVGDVCPDMDEPRTNTTGDPETIELVAPEGKLISAYCLKSGSDNADLGPKIVELDVPVDRLTVAYPTGGTCKAISHYAVTYVDAGVVASTPPSTPAETPEPVIEVAEPAIAPLDEEVPLIEDAPAKAPVTEPVPLVVDDAAAATPLLATGEPAAAPLPAAGTPSSSPSANAVPSPGASALVAVEDATLASSMVSAAEAGARGAAVNRAAVDSLPLTGAQTVITVLAAIVLIGLGSAAVIVSRRRRAASH